ncbi:alpha/beta fold hydrolase [Nocardioides sp. CPCC 205120]|uniref:alpha/beta fold hydrolase n=1 Tax=Nocardioides sp. CPCC 205120 TaxID=3406462 RepID=UPI003B502B1E
MPRTRGWVRRPDGTRLSLQVEGRRGAPALLLLQGQANSDAWWDRLRGDFTDAWLTVTFDYRGTGTTELPPGGEERGPAWSTAGFAEDAAAVLAAVGRDAADVYGTSMGGRVAQELALARPDLVRRVVVACTSTGGAPAVHRDRDVGMLLAGPDDEERQRGLVDLFYTPAWTRAHGGYDGVPRDLLGDPSMTVEAARRHLETSSDHDAADRLGGLTAPTLVLHGTDDLMVPAANADVVAGLLPDARTRLVQGGRHGFFDEHRDLVVPWVREFLTG